MPSAVDECEAEFDEDFGEVDWESVPGLETVTPIAQDDSLRAGSQPLSPPFRFQDDLSDLSQGFLNEITAVEQRQVEDPEKSATGTANAQAGPSKFRAAKSHTLSSPSMKRKKSSSPQASSPFKKQFVDTPRCNNDVRHKYLPTPQEAILSALDAFEEEMTCAICTDILASPQSGNPCGHTYCGECFQTWVSKSPRQPQCPSCRANLSRGTPYIPNFTLADIIRKHIDILSSNGSVDWQSKGTKRREWETRNNAWRNAIKPTVPVQVGSRDLLIPTLNRPSDPDFVDEEEEEGGEETDVTSEDEELLAVFRPRNTRSGLEEALIRRAAMVQRIDGTSNRRQNTWT